MRKRRVAYIPDESWFEGKGHRIAIVVEGELGFYWRQSGPFHWGDKKDEEASFKAACACAVKYNEKRGVSAEEAENIIGQSMLGCK